MVPDLRFIDLYDRGTFRRVRLCLTTPPYPRPEGFSSQLMIIVAQIIDSDLTLQSGNNIRS